jgi:hypothetical protein
VWIGGGGAATPQLRKHRLQSPLLVCKPLPGIVVSFHLLHWWGWKVRNNMMQVLQVVRGGAGGLLLLRVQDRSSAAAAATRTPEIHEMACLPRWVAGGRCQLRRCDVASDGGVKSCCWCWAYFSNGQIYIIKKVSSDDGTQVLVQKQNVELSHQLFTPCTLEQTSCWK